MYIAGVRSNYSAIAAIYPKGSSIYKQFFPKGLTEFSQLTRTNVLTSSHRMAKKAEQFKAKMGGAPFAALFMGYETNIINALSEQDISKGTLKKTRGSVKTSRSLAEDAVSLTMYAVGSAFSPDFIKCNSFFNFNLLYSDDAPTSVTRSGIVAANSVCVCIKDGIMAKSIFVISNKSDLPQAYYGTHILNGIQVGLMIEVAAHTDKNVPFAAFGSADMLFLNVKNSTDYEGNWEVKMEIIK